jgi:hypothetical protein
MEVRDLEGFLGALPLAVTATLVVTVTLPIYLTNDL